ncbi:flagellar basal body rod protein FlgC [Methylomagnum ishizawai]|uniref:Flagellar basal-body rod protein FlgC n=1 Tax=Methylomagnum ishizawai TaxID=1760988 RepID=A0A1Y6CZI9_9GAMM|nr:flagellar basal body rod protein FlgC [Methylomagnum ishizawai]BBL75615.1 flagellar basal-body rod protein FlgC [Methylomagnum ishizawai]SMF95797.1 flagellar basal-body rod protein FlgC [Methylomagnum ishizawai]
MPSFKIFDIASSGMAAQTVRLNLVASNLANAETVSSSINNTYRSRQPVFAAQLKDALGQRVDKGQADEAVGVEVLGVVESQTPMRVEYVPSHPLANKDGYIFRPNVNPIEELTNMMSASRSYQDNTEVVNTAKQLMLQTLRMGQA